MGFVLCAGTVKKIIHKEHREHRALLFLSVPSEHSAVFLRCVAASVLYGAPGTV